MAKVSLEVNAGALDFMDLNKIRAEISEEFWAWFSKNEDAQVIKISLLWIFSKRILLRDLQPLFEKIFGPRPLLGHG